MYRGTTPTLTFKTDIDVSLLDLSRTYVTLKNGALVLEYTDSELTITDNDEILIVLSQEETLKLRPTNDVEIQIRAVLNDGVTAIASNIIKTNCKNIIKSGEI